jgi:aspartate racemase
MSNQATGEYYRLLNERLNTRLGGWDNGEIVVVSANFGNIEHFVRNDLWDNARAYLAEKVDRLERAGADVIVCVEHHAPGGRAHHGRTRDTIHPHR